MRGAIVGLILMASALIPVDAGVGSAIAKILAKLPRGLRAVTIRRPTGSFVRVAARNHAEMHLLFGLQATHLGLSFVPPPGGFQSGPEGYKGPGISGDARVLKGGSMWSECTSCKCFFVFNASFYEENIGCTASATLKCTCEPNASIQEKKDRMAECANEVAATPLRNA
ncbi:uncharacterized protein LOC119383683 [Rhipicephalus sanguineus]|uniref:uncharacterized protein LOC119383683 n=1 Tax=Rhipicephalus sanguineus TaxID=34632 RepID=UPI001895CBF8|nr:uncharacterized protein LOC119383683 [Rhipicephalus sanguineus]